MTILEEKIHDNDNCKRLRLFESGHLLPYEIPLDYKKWKAGAFIHRPSNVVWIGDDLVKKTVQLRSFLLNKESNP